MRWFLSWLEARRTHRAEVASMLDAYLDRLADHGPPPSWEPYQSGECICGLLVGGDDLHRLVAAQDDGALGISEGGSFMSADFCADHCPGGCLQGCPTLVP